MSRRLSKKTDEVTANSQTIKTVVGLKTTRKKLSAEIDEATQASESMETRKKSLRIMCGNEKRKTKSSQFNKKENKVNEKSKIEQASALISNVNSKSSKYVTKHLSTMKSAHTQLSTVARDPSKMDIKSVLMSEELIIANVNDPDAIKSKQTGVTEENRPLILPMPSEEISPLSPFQKLLNLREWPPLAIGALIATAFTVTLYNSIIAHGWISTPYGKNQFLNNYQDEIDLLFEHFSERILYSGN